LSEPKREPPTQAKVSRSKGDGVQRGINSPPPRDAVSGVGGQRAASSEYLENTSTEGERSAPPPVRVVMKEQIVRATPGRPRERSRETERERSRERERAVKRKRERSRERESERQRERQRERERSRETERGKHRPGRAAPPPHTIKCCKSNLRRSELHFKRQLRIAPTAPPISSSMGNEGKGEPERAVVEG
jgi:hypothetical protein